MSRSNNCRFLLFVLLATLAATSAAQDDIAKRVGRYEVFYSAFNTTFLTPEVATAAGVVRAKDRGLLNIAIREHADTAVNAHSQEESTTAVVAHAIQGTVYDLIHRTPLAFREVREPGAVYYLAEFPISNNNELLTLDVSVTPVPGHAPIDVSIQRAFYFNE